MSAETPEGSFLSPASVARRQVSPGCSGFPELPEGGNKGPMFGLVVALCKQLGETKAIKTNTFEITTI